LFLALSVALYLSTSILAQGESAVFRQIEGAMKEKAPTWKLVHRLVSKNGKYVSYQWKSGKASLGVLIFVHDTDEQASKTYHNFDLEAFGLKRKVLEGTVLDLGTIFSDPEVYQEKWKNEGYVWARNITSKPLPLRIRKVF
jgi:hypothetical protein